MARVLSLRNDVAHFELQTELDGQSYGFEFRYNERAAQWFFNVKTSEGETILSGVPLVVDFLLFGRFKDTRLPPGALMALDTMGQAKDPGPDDLGSRVVVVYYSPSEFAA
jgi:hypothetical protein